MQPVADISNYCSFCVCIGNTVEKAMSLYLNVFSSSGAVSRGMWLLRASERAPGWLSGGSWETMLLTVRLVRWRLCHSRSMQLVGVAWRGVHSAVVRLTGWSAMMEWRCCCRWAGHRSCTPVTSPLTSFHNRDDVAETNAPDHLRVDCICLSNLAISAMNTEGGGGADGEEHSQTNTYELNRPKFLQ